MRRRLSWVPVLLTLAAAGLLIPPSPASAAIAFRAAASTNLNGSSLTLTISKPAGTVQGDVIVAGIAFRPNTATITPPSGWTLVRRQNNALGTANSLAVYYKVAGASEPASYAWTLSTSTGSAGGIMSFSGVETTNPINVEAGASTTASTLSFQAPSVITTVANTMVVTHHVYASSDRFTPPTGMTEAFDVASNAAPGCCGEAIEGNFVLQAAIGATGTKTATALSNSDNGNMHTLSLNPACPPVADATTVAASAQSAQATLYWSSSDPVLILRKAGASVTEAPTNYTTYTVGATIGASTVVYNGSAAETSTLQTGLTNATTYSYKVFAKSGTCYGAGTGTEVTARPVLASTGTAWSYMLAGGSILKPGIAGEGAIYTSSNTSRIVSLSTTDGTHRWTPVSSTAAVQGYLTWLPVGGWQYRKKITIDSTKVSATLTNFPVLVSRTDSDLPGKAQSSGNDILFTSSDGTTKLSHEIEKYVSATGELVAWVKVPSLSSTANTDLYMYYGNASATNQQDAANVWDSNYKGVWHLKEDPSGTAPQMKDSTANANHGTSNGTMTSTDQVAGQVDGSLDFDGVNDYVDAGSSAVLDNLPALTVSAWMYSRDVSAQTDEMVAKRDGTNGWKFGPSSTGPGRLSFYVIHSVSALNRATVSNSITVNTWHHVAVTWDGSTTATNVKIYINGSEATYAATDNATGSRDDSAQALTIGARVPGTNPFNGVIDEARVSNTVRSAGWITTEYNNQNSPSTFYSVAAEELSGITVIGGDQSGRVYAVDARFGVKAWGDTALTGADAVQAGVSAQVREWSNAAFQAAFTTDVIFAATRNTSSLDNKVFALRADTGAVLWTFNNPVVNNVDKIVGQPWVDYARNRLYVASRAGVDGTQPSLWVLNALDGSLVQSFALNHVETSPTLSFDGATLYVGNMSGSLYAINAGALTLKWTNLSASGTAIKGVIWEDITTAGRLYFVTADGNLWCIQDDGAGASLVWKTATPIAGATTPLPLGALYTGSSDGTLHKINLSTGVDELQFTVGDGTKTVGDASTETGSELFVGTTEKLYKISPLP